MLQNASSLLEALTRAFLTVDDESLLTQIEVLFLLLVIIFFHFENNAVEKVLPIMQIIGNTFFMD